MRLRLCRSDRSTRSEASRAQSREVFYPRIFDFCMNELPRTEGNTPLPSFPCAYAALRVPRSEDKGRCASISADAFFLSSRIGEECHVVTGRGQLFPGANSGEFKINFAPLNTDKRILPCSYDVPEDPEKNCFLQLSATVSVTNEQSNMCKFLLDNITIVCYIIPQM
jgi:hypothetical protein